MLELRPFQEADLPLVEPWFDDEETQKFVGSRPWPRRALTLGRRKERTVLLALEGSTPVALVDVERSAGTDGYASESYCALVVDPARRRQGVAQEALRAILARPEVCGERLVGNTHEENMASRRLFATLGFVPMGLEPDDDGFLYFSHDSGVI